MTSGPAAAGAVAQVFVADVEKPVASADDLHHLVRVLRVRPGEAVVVADGAGAWRLCRLGEDRPGALVPQGDVQVEPGPAEAVTVGFVPVKGDRPEWVVHKLTELGVDRIVVLRAARSVVHWEGEREPKAMERLGRVARAASAQSRRVRLPTVQGVWSLHDMADGLAPDHLALADRAGAAPAGGLRCLAVGPEGGWDPPERLGLPLVSLGRGVLRAETAAVAAGTLLCALRDGWSPPAGRQWGSPEIAADRGVREAGFP